jgi:hypothetical protein
MVFVIPAQAEIQAFQWLLDSRIRRIDGVGGFLRFRQNAD